jgi:hypothetical protein
MSRGLSSGCAVSAVVLVFAIACARDDAGRGDGSGGLDDTGVGSGADTSMDADSSDAGGDSTSASDPDTSHDDAEIVAFEYAPVMACGESSSAQLLLLNIGTTTWSADAGYLLASVGGSLGAAQAHLEAGGAVDPGETWPIEIVLEAPSEDGSHAGSWQMLRGATAFGPVATADVQVDCTPEMPELPDVFHVVQAVAAEYGHLLETNTYESCGEFIQRVLMALADDPEWGHVAKTAGEGQYSPPGWEPVDIDGHLITGFSHDVIFHRAAYRQVDIIVNASANSDPNPDIWGPASIGWDVIDPKHYRENNPWMPPVPP